MVEQLARFLGVSCDKAQLESLIEHCHQLVDQCCNAEALPVGRGTRPCLCPARCPAPAPLLCPAAQVLLLQSPLLCVGRGPLGAVCAVTEQTVFWFPGGPRHVPGSVGKMFPSRCLPRWPRTAEPGWSGR